MLALKNCANNPNNGGVIKTPRYAVAINRPINACDFSFPKLIGVECITEG